MPENRRDHTKCVRFGTREIADLTREAHKDQLLHVDGDPDWSAIIRRLIAEAIRARKPD